MCLIQGSDDFTCEDYYRGEPAKWCTYCQQPQPRNAYERRSEERAVKILWSHYNKLVDNNVWSEITAGKLHEMVQSIAKEIEQDQ